MVQGGKKQNGIDESKNKMALTREKTKWCWHEQKKMALTRAKQDGADKSKTKWR